NIPNDVVLRYGARVAPRNGAAFGPSATDDLSEMGSFVGTRGRALPLTQVTMQLSGRGASRYAMSAEGLFLGAQLVRKEGGQVQLSGPTGRETLVGLAFSIREVGNLDHLQKDHLQKDGIDDDRRQRVRVFRGTER